MLTLSVIGVEDGSIIAASASGERFRIPVDAALRSRLRGGGYDDETKRLSPREIQAHVRQGLSPQQVATLTGAPVAYVERFVGPVLAELAYVVESALAVRVQPATEGGRGRTFGALMTERLASLAASGVRWSSLKEASGAWILRAEFQADDIEHDARWLFDAKRLTLVPQNLEAVTLSQAGSPVALSPRLHALTPTGPVGVVPTLGTGQPIAVVPPEPDRSRFDSAVFQLPDLTEGRGLGPAAGPTPEVLPPLGKRIEREPGIDTASLPVTRAMSTIDPREVAPRHGATTPGPVGSRPRFAEPSASQIPLRRSRSGRRGAPEHSGPVDQSRVTDDGLPPTRPVAVPAPVVPKPTTPSPTAPASSSSIARPRRGRTSMPSWDEIVYGKDED